MTSRRDDLKQVLVLGPGSGAEERLDVFVDASLQACVALKEEGVTPLFVGGDAGARAVRLGLGGEVRTLLAPLEANAIGELIAAESLQAVLPLFGGHTAFSLASELAETGVFASAGVEVLGSSECTLRDCHSRLAQLEALEAAGLPVAPASDGEVGAVAGGARRRVALQVARDAAGTVAVLASSECIDPVGSRMDEGPAVTPALTVSGERQRELRSLAAAALDALHLKVGIATVWFSLDSAGGEAAILAVDPYFSRTAAFTSCAAGVPLAAVASRLLLGRLLHEPEVWPGGSPAALFEPELGHLLVRLPLQFGPAAPSSSLHLGGEVVAAGRTFKEAFLKALRSRGPDVPAESQSEHGALTRALETPGSGRYDAVLQAFRQGRGLEELVELTALPPFFLSELGDIVELEREVRTAVQLTPGLLRRLKGYGFGDARLGELTGRSELEVRALRHEADAAPVPQGLGALTDVSPSRCVFSAYSEGDVPSVDSPGRDHVLILGAGAGAEGSRGEYDESCAHAVRAARALGYATTVIDCTLSSVSAGAGAPDRFFLGPVALEEVLDLIILERPRGVVAQFVGGPPQGLAEALKGLGIPLFGTPFSSLALLSDPVERSGFLARLGVPELKRQSTQGSSSASASGPFPLGELLGGDLVFDVLLLADATGGAELVGVAEELDVLASHREDAARVTPPLSLGGSVIERAREVAVSLASALQVCGVLAVKFVSREGRLFVLDVALSSPRLVRLFSESAQVELAEVATRLALGAALGDVLPSPCKVRCVSVEVAAAPRPREGGEEPQFIGGMSTVGRVVATAASLPVAFERALLLAGTPLPLAGQVFLSVQDREWPLLAPLAGRLQALGFSLAATSGTATALSRFGITAAALELAGEDAVSVPTMIGRGDFVVALVTPPALAARGSLATLGRMAYRGGTLFITSLAAAAALVAALEASSVGQEVSHLTSHSQEPRDRED